MDLSRKYPGKVSLQTKVRRVFWNAFALFFFRPFITPLFRRWRIAVLKMFGAEIEWDAQVYASAKVWAPWLLKMGHRACIEPCVICYNQDRVEIEDDAVVSQYAYLCTASHDVNMMNTSDKSLVTAPILIRKKAWVGSRAYVGLGVCIGECAVVGATASVYKSVDDYAIVGGNPAKVLKKRILS